MARKLSARQQLAHAMHSTHSTLPYESLSREEKVHLSGYAGRILRQLNRSGSDVTEKPVTKVRRRKVRK